MSLPGGSRNLCRWLGLVAAVTVFAGCGPSATRARSSVGHPTPSTSPTPSTTATPTPGSATTHLPAVAPSLAPGAVHRGVAQAPPAAGIPPMATPAPGSYQMHLSSDRYNGSATLSVAGAPDSSGRSFDETIHTPSGSERSGLTWRPDGVYLTQTTFGSGSQSATCTWQPAVLAYQLPLSVGLGWDSDSSCPVSYGAFTGTAREVSRESISGKATVIVGGQQVPTYVVEISTTVTFKMATNTYTVTSTGRDWLAPGLGLAVRQTRTSQSSSQSPDGTTVSPSPSPSPSSFTLEMTSLQPS